MEIYFIVTFVGELTVLRGEQISKPGGGGTSLFGIYGYVLYVHRCLSSSSIVHVIGKFGKYSNTVVFLLF